jgi:alpha(1,3/1,4) fucosyltransferase
VNIGFWNFYNFYNRNRMLSDSSSIVGEELAYFIVHLTKQLRQLGHQVATIDMQHLDWFDKIFFLDYPTKFNSYFRRLVRRKHPELHLILIEPPIIRPDNYDLRKHRPFKTVLTWKKDLCVANPQKYRLYHIPNKVRHGNFSPLPFAQRKLCTLINSFMVSVRPNELYSERVRAIRWFEANAPEHFDLIGTEWDKPLFTGRLSLLNLAIRFAYRRVSWLDRLRVNRFPSHIGPNRKPKHLTLHDYRFCIAYENSIETDYISEKLFDCFFSGCVPVYLGAPNILDSIPQNAFVDKRNFVTYDDLYRYISGLSEDEYDDYLTAIDSFIKSPALHPFTTEGFAETFISTYCDGPS